MDQADLGKVLFEFLYQRLRHHGDSWYPAFSSPEAKLAPSEIEILDPEGQTLHQPEAAAVEQHGDQPVGSIELPEDRAYLGGAQNDRHPGPGLSPPHLAQSAQRTVEHCRIKEQKGAEGLGLGRGGDLPLGRQMGEKGGDFGFAEIAGMAGAVVADEAENPAAVNPLGPRAKSPNPGLIMDGLQ